MVYKQTRNCLLRNCSKKKERTTDWDKRKTALRTEDVQFFNSYYKILLRNESKTKVPNINTHGEKKITTNKTKFYQFIQLKENSITIKPIFFYQFVPLKNHTTLTWMFLIKMLWIPLSLSAVGLGFTNLSGRALVKNKRFFPLRPF